MKKKLSNKANYLLFNLAAQTHPNEEFVSWVKDENKDLTVQENELIDAGYLSQDGKITKAGLGYLNKSATDADELLTRIKNSIPKNPSFDHIAQNLSDTAVVRAIYTLLGEIGRRGDPDNPPAYAWWLEKCKTLEAVLKNAEPNTLWERHNARQDRF